MVLVVLAALAELHIPMFSDIFQKTHASQCAGNLAEINMFIETYKALNLSYPDGLDSLIDEDGNDYVIFGLGILNETVGSIMQDAPLHFPDEGGPIEGYNRFVRFSSFLRKAPPS